MARGPMTDLLWISLALALVVANGFFVAAEFALVKVRRGRLEQLVQANRLFARSALWLYHRLDRSLSACQLGITMASLALGWIGEPAVARLIEPIFRFIGITSPAVIHGLAFAVGFTAITVAHLVLGEQAPKIFAIRRPEIMSLWCAMPLRLFYAASYPALRGLDAATSAILRRVGVASAAEHEIPHSEEELRVLLRQAHSHGELTATEHRLVEAAFDFDETLCRQIMVPRNEVVFLDSREPVSQWLEVARKSKHTRYPVCKSSLDHVLGVLHVKDLVGLEVGEAVDLRTLLRPPKYIPETIRIKFLLAHFRTTKQHMALVVDEYGSVVGIVTLENVLERIVGPLQDEFDAESPDIVPDGPGRFVVRGSTSLEALARTLRVPLQEDNVDTASGCVMVRLGRVPAPGDRFEIDGVTGEVLEVEGNRATSIRFEVQPESGRAPAAGGP